MASRGNMDVVEIANGGASARIHTHGATVLSWRVGGAERLYLSPLAVLDGTRAIRGGIPLVFPQFGTGPAMAGQHGFARTRRWDVARAEGSAASFVLQSDEATRAQWPHDFCLRYDVSLGADGSLETVLCVENTDAHDISFTALLHTYLAADVCAGSAVAGLRGATYVDHMLPQPWVSQAQTEELVPIAGAELERIYECAPDRLRVEPEGTTLSRDTAALPDVVVWNPWVRKAATLGDLAPGGHERFVCVEAGHVVRPVVLAPGACWTARQTLSVSS